MLGSMSKQTKYKLIAFHLEPEQIERLKALAVANERSMSAEIRLAIRAHLGETA